MELSPNFTLQEFTRSQIATRRDLKNVPNESETNALRRLCVEIMEPIRHQFGPVHITSGFRCLDLNRILRSSDASQHVKGLACDHVPAYLHGHALWEVLRDEMEWLRASVLPFDQAIYEFGEWVHVSVAPSGVRPRRQMLFALHGKDGKTIYYPWYPTLAKPR